MSAFPGATSLSKPKSRFGGLKKQGARPAKVESGFASGRALDSYMAHGSYRQTAHTLADHARRRRLHKGTPAIDFSGLRDPAMIALQLDDLRQHCDMLRLRAGKSVMVRFVEPRDADALQGYFRSLSVRSRYNRFLGAMSELPQTQIG